MKKTWLRGTLFLTLSSLIGKALSFFYKIPYQNITGDVGFYVYQTLYPLFSFFTLLSTYSIPLISTELILQGAAATDLLKHLFRYFLPMALLIFLFSPLLGKAFNDPAFSPFFLLLGVVVMLVPFLGVYRGCFYSQEETIYKVGMTNLIEQGIRVLFICVTLLLFVRGVITNVYRVAFFSYGALVLGLLLALFYLLLNNKKDGVKIRGEGNRSKRKCYLDQRLWGLTLSGSLLLLMNLIDGLTLTHRLEPFIGFDEARRLKGVYDRSLPFIQGTLFFVSPLITSYLPYLKKLGKPYRELVEVVLLFALPATIGLVLIYPNLHVIVFRDMMQTVPLQLNLFIIVLYGLVLSLLAIPHERKIVDYLLIAAALGIKCGCNLFFIPYYHLIGAVIGNLSALFFLVLSLFGIRRSILRLSLSNLAKIFLSTLVMGVSVWGLERIALTNSIVLQVMTGIGIYALLIWLMNPLKIRKDIQVFFSRN